MTQIQRLVRNVKHERGGGDKIAELEARYGTNTKQDAFLQFNTQWADDKGPQRLLGFAKASLLSVLRYSELQLHVDATFKPCPKGFSQCLIVSVIDEGTKLHIPVFFVLMTTKTEQAYDLAFTFIKAIVGEFYIDSRRYMYNLQ